MKFGITLICFGFLVSGCMTGSATKANIDAAVRGNAYQPAVNFWAWRGDVTGPTTKVATLGSQHLSELGTGFDRSTLEPLLTKLAAFNPTIITHEGLTGEQCELVQRYEKIYPGIFEDYCWGVEEGAKATGLTLPQASAEIELNLKSWPTSPSPAQRRKLISLFLASGDRGSALVQWLQLPANERTVGDGIDSALLAIMQRLEKTPNEGFSIGATLAARLGLQRIYAVDDHTADSIQAAAPSGYEPYMQAHWSRPKNASVPAVAEFSALRSKLKTGEDMLRLFRYMNLPATQRAFVELDYKDSLTAQSPQLFGRRYVAWFETRNLRMVANIRAAFGNSPGARVLNIVGVSHKAYYEAYLAQMSEVELVDMMEILK